MRLLLNSSEIATALRNEADQAKACGLMTYNFAGQDFSALAQWKELRIIMGVSPDDERSFRSASRLQGFASVNPKAQVRLLPRSHIKLAVFWTAARLGYHRAVLSTMNGAAASAFKEIGILLQGTLARELMSHFESCWKLSIPVNPLDVRAVAKALASGVFEVQERP